MVSRERLVREPYGQAILELLYNTNESLKPEYCNYYEPVNIPIPTYENALEKWYEDGFYFRRKHSTQSNGAFTIDGYNASVIGLESRWNKQINWFQLFKQLISITKAYFGYVHVITDRESEPSAAGSAICCFLYGTSSGPLKKNGIPNLGWGNYFGEEYVKELDLPLLQQHGLSIEPLGEGYVFNLTPQLQDVIDTYDDFHQRRQHIKSLFRFDLFQNYARYEHESSPYYTDPPGWQR